MVLPGVVPVSPPPVDGDYVTVKNEGERGAGSLMVANRAEMQTTANLLSLQRCTLIHLPRSLVE